MKPDTDREHLDRILDAYQRAVASLQAVNLPEGLWESLDDARKWRNYDRQPSRPAPRWPLWGLALGYLGMLFAGLSLDGPLTGWSLTAWIEPWACLAVASIALGASSARMLLGREG